MATMRVFAGYPESFPAIEGAEQQPFDRLHPAQMAGALEKMVADATAEVVFTTANPFVVTACQTLSEQGYEVTLLIIDQQGRSAPITAHPRFERATQALNWGEFWANVGEDWVADAQKSA